MLIKRFREYLDKVFWAVPRSKKADDFKAELMDSLTSRAMDLKAEGKTDDEAYKICIESLGDISDTLRSLSRNPLDTIRDKRFWRGILTAAAAAVALIVIYVIASFFTERWGLMAAVIFPAYLALLFIFATGSVLRQNIALKRHFTSGVIIGGYTVILDTALFFVMVFALQIPARIAWTAFTLIPFTVCLSSIFTNLFLRKKTPPLFVWLLTVLSASLVLFLVPAAVTGKYHPLWIVMLLGVLGDLALMILYLNNKIKNNKQKN